jgi:N-acetylneuraminic acid mutarotase
VGGSTTGATSGVYGTQGIAAAANVPGARNGAISWTDASGDLWLFGGFELDTTGAGAALSDLWKYSPSSSDWTWVGGPNAANARGTYGTEGAAAASNAPGARGNAASWMDASGNLWVFGGRGEDAAGTLGELNDLWEYSPSSGEWTWVGGSDTANAVGVYGTQGVAASGNVPGARRAAATWMDSSGNVWLLGGQNESGGTFGYLNDLWEYAPSTGRWTWVGGSNTAGASGVYGTQGVTASTNVPGARYGAIAWTDASGNAWLYGGYGYDSAGALGYLNDLWEYSPSSGEWTWVGGSDTANKGGVYGTRGMTASTNVPGARAGAVSWKDANGKLWLFGGHGDDSKGTLGELNDLWEYSPSSGEWTWVGGSDTANTSGVYGTEGSTAAANVPGGRDGASVWTDGKGNLWLFGGYGYDSKGTLEDLNDLWEYPIQ